jgi:hypothetical protein
MGKKYLRHTDDEWLTIINECRSSGYSDKIWCQENHITLSTFYYQIRRLRKKACCIPEPINDPVAKAQEVVQIDFGAPTEYAAPAPHTPSTPSAETAVRITFHRFQIEITNAAAYDTVYHTLSALQRLC